MLDSIQLYLSTKGDGREIDGFEFKDGDENMDPPSDQDLRQVFDHKNKAGHAMKDFFFKLKNSEDAFETAAADSGVFRVFNKDLGANSAQTLACLLVEFINNHSPPHKESGKNIREYVMGHPKAKRVSVLNDLLDDCATSERETFKKTVATMAVVSSKKAAKIDAMIKTAHDLIEKSPTPTDVFENIVVITGYIESMSKLNDQTPEEAAPAPTEVTEADNITTDTNGRGEKAISGEPTADEKNLDNESMSSGGGKRARADDMEDQVAVSPPKKFSITREMLEEGTTGQAVVAPEQKHFVEHARDDVHFENKFFSVFSEHILVNLN